MEHFLIGKGLTKNFGGLTALQGIDFHIDQEEIFGLIGPNGAGKTTLFNVIAGVYKPDIGEVRFKGEKLANLRPDEICKRGIARTFQITKPFLNLNVFENVAVGAYFGSSQKEGVKETQVKVEKALEMAGLKEKAGRLASNLNLVDRKHLELARALSTKPEILLLDEVMAGLNPTETSEMVKTILRIRGSGVSILMIEHIIKAVMEVSDRIMVLHYGKKIAEGSPEEVIHNPDVVQAYLGGFTFARS